MSDYRQLMYYKAIKGYFETLTKYVDLCRSQVSTITSYTVYIQVLYIFPVYLIDASADKATGLEWLNNKSYNEPTGLYDDGRKRHKHSSHSSKHSKKVKKEENELKPEIGLPPKAVWLEDVGLKPEMAYRFDKAPDIDNVRYGGLYSSDIANYRRYTNHCIGLQDEINFTDNRGKKASKKHKKTGSERYYNGSISKQQDAIVYTGSKDTVFEWDKSFVTFGIAEKQKSGEAADTVNPETSEWYISQRAKAFNQLLAEDPSDVSLWLEFLQFQDEIYLWGCTPGVDSEGGSDPKKQNHLALIERKMAICEKALHSNPLAVGLILRYMSLCEEVWDHDRIIKSWKDTVFKLPQKAALWVNYILYCQRQFSFFTVSQLSAIYAKCISTLSSLHEGLLRSHKPEGDIEQSLISIVALFCLFLRGAGHTEKAVALYQALIEFNLCSPASLSSTDVSLKERVEFLEPFWDSGAARIGEPGARGWKSWVEHENSNEKDFPDLGLLQVRQIWSEADASQSTSDDQEMELVKERPLAEAWLSVEALREAQHHLPWKPSKEGEADSIDDPDRMVLFDDVSPYLFHLTTEEMRLSLIQHFLNFLGVQTSAVSSSCCIGHHMMHSLVHTSQIAPPTLAAPPISCRISDLLQGSVVSTSCCFIGKDFDATQINSINLNNSLEPPDFNSVCFIRSFLNQCLPLLSTNSQTVIFRDWLHFELSIIRSTTPKEARKKLKSVKKLAKMLLKLDAHRNNMQLWCSYAHLELLCEGRNNAIKVCEKLLTQCSVNLESNTSLPVLEMYLYLIEIILNISSDAKSIQPSVDNSHVKHILVCLANGKYHTYSTSGAQVSSTKILWAQNKLQQACQRTLNTLLDLKQQNISKDNVEQYSLLMSCLLYFNSTITSLSDTYKLFKEHCNKLVGFKSSQQHICHLERVFITMCRVILCCQKSEPCLAQILRCVLENCLKLFPNNEYFLDCFIKSEKHCFVAGRLRRYFDTQAPLCSAPFSWLYSIRAEWMRYQTLREHQMNITIDEPTSGIIHRIRSLFYRASQSPNCRCCVLLWRLYMSFEVT